MWRWKWTSIAVYTVWFCLTDVHILTQNIFSVSIISLSKLHGFWEVVILSVFVIDGIDNEKLIRPFRQSY